MASIYLSRGGKGGKSFQSSLKEIRGKIHSLDASIQFVANPRKAEYIVIPDDGHLLADKTTHSKTKQLREFLTMLRQAVKPVSEVRERGFWQRLTKNPASDLKIKPQTNLSQPTQKPSLEKKPAIKPSKDNRLFWQNLASPTPADNLVMSIINEDQQKATKQPDATVSFLDSLLEPKTKQPSSAAPQTSFANLFGTEKPQENLNVLQPRRKQPLVEEKAKDATLSFVDSVLQQQQPTSNLPLAPKPQLSFANLSDEKQVQNDVWNVQEPRSSPESEKKPKTSKFPCEQVMETFLSLFPNAESISIAEIVAKLQTSFPGAEKPLIDQIAHFVQHQIRKKKSVTQELKSLNEGEEELKEHKSVTRQLKLQQEAEDRIDEIYNKAMEEFKTTEKTDEDWDEVLDFLEDEVTAVMETAPQPPSNTYLKDLAKELWSFREGYSAEDIENGITELFLTWKKARDEVRYKEFEALQSNELQIQLYEQLMDVVDVAPQESTLESLASILKTKIRDERKMNPKLKADKLSNQDLIEHVAYKFPKWKLSSIRKAFANLWK